jgi:serine/threonine-protein kinase
MEPQRWKEIDGIFAAALEREPAARAAFLDEACAGDERLRKEVESLLAHNNPESLVGSDALQEATRLLEKRAGELTNDRIGRYQIIRSLGVGGMGRVYLGLDEQLNRPVAVKLLSNYGACEEERMRRFRQEALSASALNHPNILTIYEIGEFEGTNFITAEFVDGLTLRARLKAGALPPDLALDIAIQIASALSAAHASGIIHRDIKPENVMVRADGLVKVLDFGIAKFTQLDGDELKSVVETMPGRIIGTAAYMSPEQARGTGIDARSDLWSLGVILYEMVAHQPPFWGNTAADVIAAVLDRQPAPFSVDSSSTLQPLEPMIFKALQKERENRYQTAAELLTDLKQLRQSLALAGEKRSPSGRSSDPQTELSVRRSAKRQGLPAQVPQPAPVLNTLLTDQAAQVRGAGGLVTLRRRAFLAYRSRLSNKGEPIESIAVMPFSNESSNEDIEYLSDGMTDSLINSLSQLPHLSVKARSSVFRYKGKEVEPQRIGSDLSVQAVLSGRVVQRGDDLTLYLSLVEAQTGNQLWGEQYDRKVADLISLQREIAHDVSQKLRARLSGAEVQRVTKDYTENAEAYQLYLKGRYHVIKLRRSETQIGIPYFQKAIELDPHYALAYAGLAEAYRSLALPGEMPAIEFFPKAKAAAQKAIELDDALAEGHAQLGLVNFWFDWDWSKAEKECKRALELDPRAPETLLLSTHLLSTRGRHVEALAEIKRARELEPLNLRVNSLEGQFLIFAGQNDEALARFQKTFEIDPNFWFTHAFAASAYIEKGMFSLAVAEANKASALSEGSTHATAFMGYALAKAGKQAEARSVLETLLKLSTDRYVPPYHIALIYNGLGERDQTLAWLERGYLERDSKMVFLSVEPKWNNLHSDPRFVDLLRRVGLSQSFGVR